MGLTRTGRDAHMSNARLPFRASRATLVVWALVAAATCWRLDPRHLPLTGDNQLYFFVAERAASGVPPHVSHVDPKHQLATLLTAGAITAGRAVGVDDVAAARIVSIAAASIAVALAADAAAVVAGALVARAGVAAAGARGAGVAGAGALATSLSGAALAASVAAPVAAAALLAMRGFAHHATVGSNPKVFLAMFVLLAQAAIARPSGRARDAVAGLACGAAFLCWQPALVVVAAVAAEGRLGPGGSWRRTARLLAWALLPVVLYEAYFVSTGAAGEQLWQNWVMTLGSVHEAPRAWRSLAFVLGEGRGAFVPRVAPTCLAVLVAFAVARLVRSPSRAIEQLRSRDGLVAFAVGAAGATMFTLYDHQGVPDLFFPAPYFAIAAGVVAARVAGAASRFAPRATPAAVLVVLLVMLALQLRRDEARRHDVGYDLADQRRLAAELLAEHEAGGSVWAYGAVHLLALAHLDNHVPLALFFDDVASVVDVGEFRPLKDGRLPSLIVQGRRRFPDDAAYLGERYEPATTAEFAGQDLRLWRRVRP